MKIQLLILAMMLASTSSISVFAQGGSPEAGKRLYFLERTNAKGEKMSCTTCHTEDPKKTGRSRAGKDIKPMATVANPERFTDQAKVAKWFKRNCRDVLDRECTEAEKADFIAYLKSIR